MLVSRGASRHKISEYPDSLNKSPESIVMAAKTHHPGESVVHRGVYLVLHYLHRSNHHCRIETGSFPTCNVCLHRVQFEVTSGTQSAPLIWDDPDFRPVAAAAKSTDNRTS